MKTCRILIADDHPAVCRGVRSLLAGRQEWEVCGEAHTGEEAVELAKSLKPDAIILDLSLPRGSGLEAARQIHAQDSSIGILVLSMHDAEPMMRAALKAGVRGYVLKTELAEQLAQAVEAVCQGRVFFSPRVSETFLNLHRSDEENAARGNRAADVLTPRQIQVLQFLAQGRTNKEIGAELGISMRTVEAHRYTIMERLKIQTFSELVLYAVRHRLVEPDGTLNPC